MGPYRLYSISGNVAGPFQDVERPRGKKQGAPPLPLIPEGLQPVEIQVYPVPRSLRGRGRAILDGQGMLDEALQAKAVHLQI